MTKFVVALPLAAVLLAGCSMKQSADTVQKSPSAQDTSETQMGETTDMMKEPGVEVGGATMVKSKNIVDNAVNSKDHTTLVEAVKAAGLVEILQGPGPFTVFAPTNAAFAKLPTGTVETLLKPENKAMITKILTYHAVTGIYTSKDLKDGQVLNTIEGEGLTVIQKDGKWWLKDAKGGMSMITIADVIDSNGVTHVIDTVLMPK